MTIVLRRLAALAEIWALRSAVLDLMSAVLRTSLVIYMYYSVNGNRRLPLTKTSTALDVSPGASGEYGVHVYFPSSSTDTGLMSRDQ